MTVSIPTTFAGFRPDRPIGMPPNNLLAERLVRENLVPPSICPHCCCSVNLVNNSMIYGSPVGEWPWAYQCSNHSCGAYIDTHPFTDRPKGTLATPVLREARKRAENRLNTLWQSRRMTRDEAYRRLARELGIELRVCHFEFFDEGLCQRAAGIALQMQLLLRR